MNIANIKAAIAGMNRILKLEQKLDVKLTAMELFQSRISKDGDVSTIPYCAESAVSMPDFMSQNHRSCGTAACLAGHMALMPHFRRQGLRPMVESGVPTLMGDGFRVPLIAHHAISYLLETDLSVTCKLCCIGVDGNEFYGKSVREITTQDVIEQLETLLKQAETIQ